MNNKIPGIKAKHAIVTQKCRENGGAEEAFEEALSQLWIQANSTHEIRQENNQDNNINYHFILSVEDKEKE